MTPIARPSQATPFALTRFAGPDWERQIPREFQEHVEKYFHTAVEQHPMRRWEYSMALLAWETWKAAGYRAKHQITTEPYRCLDVGGAGSPLGRMLVGPATHVSIVDPGLPPASSYTPLPGEIKLTPLPIEQLHLPHPVDAFFSISVLEHVEDVDSFLYACNRLLATGGLLFLTVDAWDPPVEFSKDTAHFHWMRKRIFSRGMLLGLLDQLHMWGYEPLGAMDLEYKGNTVYDYTFASLALVKGA